LQAVHDYRSVLCELDPADIGGFLGAARAIEDLLCLSLLALVWDPDVAMRLSVLFTGFAKKNYTADDLYSAFDTVLTEFGVDMGDVFDKELREQYSDITTICGSCRFFGLKQLCARLRITRGGASEPASAKAHRSASKRAPRQLDVLEDLIRWNEQMRSDMLVAVRQAKEHRQVLPLWQACQTAIFSDLVPMRMRWGRSAGKYPGEHIVRKLVLKYEGKIGKMQWCREAILAGPDVKGHLSELQFCNVPTLTKDISPVLPSRLSMWTCLMGQAFKLCPGAEELWRSGRVPVDMFRRHAVDLTRCGGVNPHVKQVWASIVAELA